MKLGTLILALYYYSGRNMCNSHCRGCLIDMLSTCTTGTVGIYLKVIFIYLYLNIFVNIRHNITGNKRGLTFARRIKRRYSDQSVYSGFALQISVCIFTANLYGY